MAGARYEFDYAPLEGSIIKVIGVGGGGSNAVNYMYSQGIKGVDFFVCNTDVQALELSPVPNKIQIGGSSTKGLGAGANPEKGKSAAIESKDELKAVLGKNTKMLFITAGMGGGTGTGAAPVIAEIAKDMGILTVGIVTAPFNFEGKPKMKRADDGIAELRRHCDTVLVILNNKIKEVYGSSSMKEAFSQADNVLSKAAKAIAEIITISGDINVDFEDVRTVMKESGVAVMGSASAEGDNRARRAVEAALNSPLLNDTDIYGSKYVLLNVTVGSADEFKFDELEEITHFVQEKAGEEAELIFGTVHDSNLAKAISVTIIATGFRDKAILQERRVFDLESSKILTPILKLEIDDNMDFFDKGDDLEDLNRKPAKKEPKIITPKHEKVVFQLEGDDYKAFQDYEEERKKKVMEQQYEIRKQQLESIKPVVEMTNEELQEKREVPAYLRKNVKLAETPHSSKSEMSRSKINDDGNILGNNRFLHDNVD